MPGRSSTGEKPRERFTGYEYDEETQPDSSTGLYYAGARYYDPIIGRFSTVDRFLEKYPSMTPYQYAANNPIGFIDVNGDSAWAITGRWDEETIARYRGYAAQQLGYYFDRGILCTCEDLALNVLIDFASANGLPVAITNGTGILSASSDAFSNVADFRNAVLKTTGANDLVQFGNTVGVGSSPGDPSQLGAARAGDLILLSYRTETDYALTPGYPPARLGQRSIYTHGQVVQSAEGGVVNIVQGNFRFSGFGQVAAGVRAKLAGADWNDPRQQAYYIGAPPARNRYTQGVYGGSDPNVFANRRGIVRAWNFAGMNGR